MKFFPKTLKDQHIHRTIKQLWLCGWNLQGAIDRLREEAKVDPSTHGFDDKELDAFLDKSLQNNINLNK